MVGTIRSASSASFLLIIKCVDLDPDEARRAVQALVYLGLKPRARVNPLWVAGSIVGPILRQSDCRGVACMTPRSDYNQYSFLKEFL